MMDVPSYLVFLFLPALVFITAVCLYKKMKEASEYEERIRNSGYPNAPAFESPLPVQPHPSTIVPDYSRALNMRRDTAISIDSTICSTIPYHIYDETCHPMPMFSPFEPPPPYPGSIKVV